MKKLVYFLLLFLFILNPVLRAQFSSETKKTALLNFLRDDPSTSSKYNDIAAMLNKQGNLDKVSACTESAMNYQVAKKIRESKDMGDLEYSISNSFGDDAYRVVWYQYFGECKYLDNYTIERNPDWVAGYPPYSEIKSAVDFFVLSINSGMDRFEVFNNMEVLYGKEIEMLNNVPIKSPSLGTKPEGASLFYLTYLYRMDFLKQVKIKMEDVERFSGNDMVFCVRKIIKMLDENSENNSTGENTLTGASFTGKWDCWGTMILTQSGTSLNGSYGYLDGLITNGTIKDNTATCHWSQSNKREGTVIFTLSTDGNSIDGKWKYSTDGESDAWREDWDAKRIQ
ncbi:MAG: hypothetical protein EHM58_13760 [Ignavibacteriae bacterium]|nr:MAG: hypothetical protein EHM58_13760 [Ignavibacteriota bacterium]